MAQSFRRWRSIVALTAAATLFGAPAAAQEGQGEGSEVPPQDAAAAAAELPAQQRPDERWPLLLTGVGLTAGGLLAARLSHLETERWQAMPAGTADRQRHIETWSTATVAGSVAAAVGVGLIALWATIRLSQARPAPAER